MTRQKVKLAMVANENSRTISLKKRKLGLVKKVSELTILCDVKACMIIFSPNDPEPLVWPSSDVARELLGGFFALPESEKKKKETSIESYIKDKTRKLADQLVKTKNKNKEFVTDNLMAQLQRGRGIEDLNLNEIFSLLTFAEEKIMHFRKRLDSMEHAPLREPPKRPIEAQSEELKALTIQGGGQGDVRARSNTAERVTRIHVDAIRESQQSHYLMDQWFFPSPEPSNLQFNNQIGAQMLAYNEIPNPRSYLPYQGRNPILEMEQIGTQVMTFHGLAGPVSQPMQHHNINNAPMMGMSHQPRQYPYDFMSRELGVKHEGKNQVNNGASQFHLRSNAMMMADNRLRQEPPPPPQANGATGEEGNGDAMSFDLNGVWPRINY